jgi:uncharacterized protein (DUF2236 family)
MVTRIATVAPRGVPVLREGVQLLLRQVFGADPPDRARPGPDGSASDPGLCGPGSPSWRVIAEPAAIAGGVRALLLQALHPLAMAGVARHSRYREDPLARLQTTSAWVTGATFGTVDQVLELATHVRRAHRVVRGTAPDGRGYAASDPRLLVWVSIALTSSFLAADRLWAPHPVTGADADRFVAEQSRMAALLDERVDLTALRTEPGAAEALRSGRVELPLMTRLPADVAGLIACLEDYADELAGGPQTADAVRFLRWPPLPPAVRAAYVPVFAGAVGSLSGWQRTLLGLPTSRLGAWTAVANTATLLTTLRSAVGRSPVYDAAHARVSAAAA